MLSLIFTEITLIMGRQMTKIKGSFIYLISLYASLFLDGIKCVVVICIALKQLKEIEQAFLQRRSICLIRPLFWRITKYIPDVEN